MRVTVAQRAYWKNGLYLPQGKTWAKSRMSSSPRWQWIVIALLILCIIGYIWTLQ
jgi:hypothetical protein